MKQNAVFFLLLVSAFLYLPLCAEPSAFGAGNLNSPKPYGLTSSEKVILETKKTLHKVSVKSNNQANELDSLRDRIDGFQSIIESLSRKAHNNQITLAKFIENNEELIKSSNEYDKRLSEIIQENSRLIEENKKSIEQQKLIMSEMSILIDTINTKYISKLEFNVLVKDVNNFKSLMVKELKKSKKKTVSKPTLESMSSADVYNQAKKFFNKKYYTNAIQNYEYLIKKNYKPAYAHYMIGEMNFRRKNYSNAISYFKKSSSLYSEAKYMPTLMLHTAVSMQNTGDINNALTFFEAIITKYPNSTEASEAKNYIQQ